MHNSQNLLLVLLFLLPFLLLLFHGLAFARLGTRLAFDAWYRVDHPGLRRTRTAPKGFALHGARPLLGIAAAGELPGNAPYV